MSAFRIIGNLDNTLSYYKNLIFPKCFYFTQYDFYVLPNWKVAINKEINERLEKGSNESRNEENSFIILDEIHNIMAIRVSFLMHKIPFLRPYFELLKMITFAIHYLPNVQKADLFPLFNNSLQNKLNSNYCKSIPSVFPPLPVRRTTNLEIIIKTNELFNCFNNNNYIEINKFISICYYETKSSIIEKTIEKQSFKLEKIRAYVKNKIKNNLPLEDKNMFKYFSDENMKISYFENKFKEYLFYLPLISISENVFIIHEILSQQDNAKIKPKKSIVELFLFSEIIMYKGYLKII
jgi:hypothetical protein